MDLDKQREYRSRWSKGRAFQVYTTPEQKELIRRAAYLSRRSMTDIFREGAERVAKEIVGKQ